MRGPLAFVLLWIGYAQANCLEDSATKYHVSANLLKAMIVAESAGNASAISDPNVNGSTDIGLMQINSSWLPALGKFNIKREDLFKPCTNIDVGAWILSKSIEDHGNTWLAVGYYNSSQLSNQIIYTNKVNDIYKKIIHKKLIQSDHP